MDTFNFDALGVKFTHKIRHGIPRLSCNPSGFNKVPSLTLPMAARYLLGPFPFLVSFSLTEWFKIHFTIYSALSNFSTGLQLCLIADISCLFEQTLSLCSLLAW